MEILIKGAGDIATGIAVRLYNAGFRVAMTETATPTTVRRTVAFSRAVYESAATVEQITARLISSARQLPSVWDSGEIPLLIDPQAAVLSQHRFDVVVDAILAKKNLGTTADQAPIVIGVGIGGGFDSVAALARRALLRPLDSANPDAYYAGMERGLLAEINALGIGPQGFGGDTTALAVLIEAAPTHIAMLPAAVCICCHADRHAEEVL